MLYFYENIKMSFESIKSNKVRSFLTMLGIIIGIASVIAIIALGRGGKEVIMGEFEKIGISTVKVNVDRTRANNSDYITLEDLSYIKNKAENIKYATIIATKNGICKSDKIERNAYLIGATPDYKYIENAEVLFGRYITENDLESARMVCIIDDATAEILFGYQNAVGEYIYLGKSNNLKKMKVIGITKAASYMNSYSKEYIPSMITLPISAMDKICGRMKIDSVYVLSDKKENIEAAANETINILSARHNNRGKDIYISEQMMKQVKEINKVINIFTSFISCVAAISLIVGGIGVMNIMLVSVTERTKEIGIRKAIGANTKSILLQFLTEAIIISVIGGIIGLAIGLIGSYIIGRYIGIVPSITIMHIVFVILFSSSIGVFFGIYPAKKAAELNPIDALRYE